MEGERAKAIMESKLQRQVVFSKKERILLALNTSLYVHFSIQFWKGEKSGEKEKCQKHFFYHLGWLLMYKFVTYWNLELEWTLKGWSGDGGKSMKKWCERNLITILGFLKSKENVGSKSHGRRKGGCM